MGVEAAIGIHHEVQDLFVLDVNDDKSLFRTVAFQDIDSWSQQLWQTISRHEKRNVASKIGQNISRIFGVAVGCDSVRLFDPFFCGTGTVLLEALRK